MEAGARVAGSRFAYLKGDLVLLELALVRWTLELLGERGFEPVIPPVLVREEALFGTGFLPDTEQQIYRLADDALYLAGTSEVALASLHAGEMLAEADLPKRYAGFSPCFRREAGAAGRDTRGIFRVHQFDKVEMFSFVRPRGRRGRARAAARDRGVDPAGARDPLPRGQHRASTTSAPRRPRSTTARPGCPGQQRYRELTSTSNTTDFQSRRLDIRYRPDGGGKPVHAYTLNGTAVAVGRTLIALLENHQRDDGTVGVPERPAPVGCATRPCG